MGYGKIIRVLDRLARPVGNVMLCRQARSLREAPAMPVADAAIAFAFSLRNDGTLNAPTRSIVSTTVQLQKDGLARRLIFFGSGRPHWLPEAECMAAGAKELSAENISVASSRGVVDKRYDMYLLGHQLEEGPVKSAYIVAHPLHLSRAYLLCKKRFPGITFYPVEAKRSYDENSYQRRCSAEYLFIPWNILAFIEHYIRGKI